MSVDRKHIFFIGIGGIGMSALARYLHTLGLRVSGYDRTRTQLTIDLEKTGISILYEDDPGLIPEAYKKSSVQVVYTPAVKPEENRILSFYMQGGYVVRKRAKMLAEVVRDTLSLAVAGTHGKTTTSALLAHILIENDYSVSAFLGGIVEGYGSNALLYGERYSVVEADEYDRSFLHLHPYAAVITSMDADHLDIYGQASELEKAFIEFASQVSGVLVHHKSLALGGITYAVGEEADYHAENIKVQNGHYTVDIHTPEEVLAGLRLPLPGRHNIANALGAFALAEKVGLKARDIISALQTFKGIQRRFSIRYQSDKHVIIDDYAHHPTELAALLETVKEMYPLRGVMMVFQPHTYTRTRDYKEDFIRVLAQFDLPLLLPIYAAREKALEGVTSEALAREIRKLNPGARCIAPENITEEWKKSGKEVLLLTGAGDIGAMVAGVVEEIRKEEER